MPAQTDKALKVKPDDVDALHWLAHYHRLNGESDQALRLWRRVLERRPLFWPSRRNVGKMLGEQGDARNHR